MDVMSVLKTMVEAQNNNLHVLVVSRECAET